MHAKKPKKKCNLALELCCLLCAMLRNLILSISFSNFSPDPLCHLRNFPTWIEVQKPGREKLSSPSQTAQVSQQEQQNLSFSYTMVKLKMDQLSSSTFLMLCGAKDVKLLLEYPRNPVRKNSTWDELSQLLKDQCYPDA